MNIYALLSVSGLMITAVGALISVLSGLKTRNIDIFSQVCTLCGYNSQNFKSMLFQKYYSVVGFIFILIGTIVQIIANAYPWNGIVKYSYVYIIILVLLIIISILIVEKKVKKNMQ